MTPIRAGAPLLNENRSALKEWASVEVALEQGSTILLLRKGGIYEQKHGFRLEHRQFWIFPTLFHQNADDLSPTFAWALPAARERGEEPGSLRIGSYAEVIEALRVERFEALDRLTGLHPLAASTVHARFHYKRRPYLHVLLVRLHRRPDPFRLPNREKYDGCVSWVELEEALPTESLEPVLPEPEFEQRRKEILEMLGSDGVVPA